MTSKPTTYRFNARAARYVANLKGAAGEYAADYIVYWIEGGIEPDPERYIGEDDYTFNHGRAREIAAHIRAFQPCGVA